MAPACWVCGESTRECASLAPLDFVQCSECGFVFRAEFDLAATRSIYEEGAYEQRDFAVDYAARATLEERRANARARLKWLLGIVREGRLLDVGAAAGAFVLEAREAGFDAFGVEPSPGFARHAREELRIDVRDGRLEDLALPEGSLDAATIWHVLEHVPEPRGTLELVRRTLRPDGLLFVEVPNFGSVAARRMGLAWTHLDPKVHVSQFTPESLLALMRAAGLEVVDLHTVAHGVYLSARERWSLRHVAHRLKLARGGAFGLRHGTRHEFIRALARPAR